MGWAEDVQMANVMRKLYGEICTPPHLNRSVVRDIEAQGLMKFHEWPSGHWAYTDKGISFLNYIDEERQCRDAADYMDHLYNRGY